MITGEGTIDDLVADAAAAGYKATPRLIRDWTQQGLLDYPRKRFAGRGRGSEQAVYPDSQRNLLITLLAKRADGNNISSLARIPVCIWMYWGDKYVPLSQARRALMRFLADPESRADPARDAMRASRQRAQQVARGMLGQLDNPAATPQSRRELIDVLTDAAWSGKPDLDRIETAIRDVFEPGYNNVHRAVGHPAAPMLAESIITSIQARITAVSALFADRVSDEDLTDARDAHLFHYADYAARQPYYAAAAPRNRPTLYEPVTAEDAVANCCGHLLSAIGLHIMYPEAAAQMRQARAFKPVPPPSAFGLTAMQGHSSPAAPGMISGRTDVAQSQDLSGSALRNRPAAG
jgi:hypothetical protein